MSAGKRVLAVVGILAWQLESYGYVKNVEIAQQQKYSQIKFKWETENDD